MKGDSEVHKGADIVGVFVGRTQATREREHDQRDPLPIRSAVIGRARGGAAAS